jgi:hypothetical protein
MYSLIVTCKLNDEHPVQRLDESLPWNRKPVALAAAA